MKENLRTLDLSTSVNNNDGGPVQSECAIDTQCLIRDGQPRARGERNVSVDRGRGGDGQIRGWGDDNILTDHPNSVLTSEAQ